MYLSSGQQLSDATAVHRSWWNQCHTQHLSQRSGEQCPSNCASMSSIEDMLQSDAEEDVYHTNQSTNQQEALSPAQLSAIENIVSQSVHGPNHIKVNYQPRCQHGWFSGRVV